MPAAELLAALTARGVALQAAGDKLRFAPADAVTPELRDELRHHKAELLALLAKRPPLPTITLRATPLDSARARLADYRATYGAQTPAQWLEHAKRAVEVVRATFAPERRQHALTTYLAHYCQGQPAQVIAAHVIALELWTADGRQRQSGVWLDVACQAVGLDRDRLPQERVN